jgi:hypothetical protein
MLVFRLALVVVIFVAANVLMLAAPRSMAAERVGGEAYGLAVGSPPATAPGGAYVQLPPAGGSVSDSSPGAGFGLGNADASTTQIDTRSTGDAGAGSVTSTVTMADGELLGGVVRVRDVRVTATTTSGGRATSTATITFGSLIVAGISYPSPSINQRIEVPGVGIVIVNEQITGGNGGDASSIIARAVRMQITASSVMDLPRGTELILAYAAAGVPDVAASRPVAAAPTATATDVPWASISPYRPVDVSLNTNFNSNSNGNFSFDNGNDNVAKTATTAPTLTKGTSTPIGIVITVIVVQGTDTPTPTATATATTAAPTATPTPTTKTGP